MKLSKPLKDSIFENMQGLFIFRFFTNRKFTSMIPNRILLIISYLTEVGEVNYYEHERIMNKVYKNQYAYQS